MKNAFLCKAIFVGMMAFTLSAQASPISTVPNTDPGSDPNCSDSIKCQC